ncbi:MAG: hypothetical protein EBS53_15490 [Bacteroidetes bacterium]|nr:hypothetical protein [Bacteroidota bacterium]
MSQTDAVEYVPDSPVKCCFQISLHYLHQLWPVRPDCQLSETKQKHSCSGLLIRKAVECNHRPHRIDKHFVRIHCGQVPTKHHSLSRLFRFHSRQWHRH